MTITKEFIEKIEHEHELVFSADFINWLIMEYEWEPYDGYWHPDILEQLVLLNYRAYKKGNINTKAPTKENLWKNRFNELRNLIEDMHIDLIALREEIFNLHEKYNIDC